MRHLGVLPWFNWTGFNAIFLAKKQPDLDGRMEGYPWLKYFLLDLNKKGGQRTDGAINRLGGSEAPLPGKELYDIASWSVTSFSWRYLELDFMRFFLQSRWACLC